MEEEGKIPGHNVPCHRRDENSTSNGWITTNTDRSEKTTEVGHKHRKVE